MIVGSTPGLTRDIIAIPWTWINRPVQLVDTSGMRKITQRDTIEDLGVWNAMRAVKTADVAALVLDAQDNYLSKQQLEIANAVLNKVRSLVITANKMDLIVDNNRIYSSCRNDVLPESNIISMTKIY